MNLPTRLFMPIPYLLAVPALLSISLAILSRHFKSKETQRIFLMAIFPLMIKIADDSVCSGEVFCYLLSIR